jgi:predicted house-cleaning noncanonical NTP pyrophosphatase (MazG superfamily)
MNMRLVKLVRNRIGRFLIDPEVVYTQIEDPYVRLSALRRKLVEEAVEYVMDPSVAELADVLEVVRSLAEEDPAVNVGFGAIMAASTRRREEAGALTGGIGMYVRTRSVAEADELEAEQ